MFKFGSSYLNWATLQDVQELEDVEHVLHNGLQVVQTGGLTPVF